MPRGKGYRRKPAKKRRAKKKSWAPTKSFGNPNTPLMPDTRLVKMRYTTRFEIDPAQVASGNTDVSPAIKLHTLYANMLNDTDYTSSSINPVADGAPNHQPRMYDQWHLFYEFSTVVGSRIKIKALPQRRIQLEKGTATTDPVIPVVVYDPVYVGILKNRRHVTDAHSPVVKFDDVMEKRMANIRLLKGGNQGGQPVTFNSGWSLKKEPSRKTDIRTKNAEDNTTWGSPAGLDIPSNNQRFYHIFAHAGSMTDDEDPSPVTFEVTMDYMVLLSDLKDVAQSA